MVFSSFVFLWIFFPVVLGIYYLINERFRNIWLVCASLFFYTWGEPNYFWLIIFSVFCNWICGLWIERSERKWIPLLCGLVINLGLLFFFKYFIWVCNLIYGQTAKVPFDIALPIGISFYTFQSLSYLIDLYKGKIKVQKNVIALGLYITFFPQLIAGPIVKYIDIASQIEKRTFNRAQFLEGIRRFSYGLGQKIIIANNLGGVINNIDGIGIAQITGVMAWVSSICYTLQIYFDFMGYSNMAIGLGKMFGFDFCENFNLPYCSRSVSEFWRRWHISLGSWFREYVYIPLGGNKKGEFRTAANLLMVFALTGIWHGANITFLVWGLYYGVLIVFERLWLNKGNGGNNYFRLLYTLFVVNIGWVIFRNDSLAYSFELGKRMIMPFKYSPSDYNILELIGNIQIVIIVFGIILSGVLQKLWDEQNFGRSKLAVSFEKVWQVFVVLISLLMLSGNSYNPFIYFRF